MDFTKGLGYILLTGLLLFNVSAIGQDIDQDNKNEHSVLLEEHYGTDNLLVHGLNYIPSYPKADGHPYLNDSPYNNCEVHIKGTLFSGLTLKYNVADDDLILQIKDIHGLQKVLVLEAEYIDSFRINNRPFIRIHDSVIIETDRQYLNMIFNGDFIFVKSFYKIFNKYSLDQQLNGRYSSLVTKRWIIRDKIYKADSRAQLLKVFPLIKKEIKKYLRKNQTKYKRLNDEELHELMSFIDNISVAYESY